MGTIRIVSEAINWISWFLRNEVTERLGCCSRPLRYSSADQKGQRLAPGGVPGPERANETP